MPFLSMRHALLAAAAAPLCGCNVLDTESQRSFALDRQWSAPAAFTTADVRIITQREHPLLHNQVLCTEPSPDVAKALTSSGSVTAQGGNGAVNASLGASASSAEALAELAGRSTALLAVRDSLFKACEAYANGAIGQAAYALVLSRYPQLMTTLFLAEDVTRSAGAEGKAAAVTAAQQISQTPAGTGSGSSTPAPAPSGEGKTKRAEAAARAALYAAMSEQSLNWTGSPAVLRPIMATKLGSGEPATQHGVASDPSGTAPGAEPDATPQASAPGAAAAPAASGGGASAADALTLARMNEDYMHQDLLGVLVVACIDENDPTRLSNGRPNPFLSKICDKIDLEALTTTAARDRPWQPVNPEVAAGGSTKKSGLPGKKT